MTEPSDWARDYFDRGYAERWGLPAPSDGVRAEAAGLWTLLRLLPASRVVDIACGHGRHALALAQRGSDVVGVDFSAPLLRRARELAGELRLRARWIRADMRSLPLRTGCAWAAIATDAFGLLGSDEEDAAMLREARRVLTIGGRIALKVVNGGRILDAPRGHDVERRGGTEITISRTFTGSPAMMTERLHVDGPDGRGDYERRQRLYRVDELSAALEGAGFAILGVFASPDGAPFDAASSPAMWAVAERR
jgi:SAM-dependent methyltransferase